MDQVAIWYAEGLSGRQIAHRLGVSSRTVFRHMQAAEIQMRPAGPKLGPIRPEERAAIVAAAQTGEPPAAIAARIGRSESAVRAILRDVGLTPRDRDRQRVRELYVKGLRGLQIDRVCGWREGKAGVIQQQLGLDPRHPDPSASEVAGLYRDLGTVAAVARHLQRHEAVISRVLRSAGAEVPRRGGTTRDPDLAKLEPHLEAIRMARTGSAKTPLQELAARYGVSYATLVNFTVNHQIVSFRKVNPNQHDRMVALHAEGMSKAEIGRLTGFSATTVDRHVT